MEELQQPRHIGKDILSWTLIPAKAILIYANSYLEAGEFLIDIGRYDDGMQMIEKAVKISPEMKAPATAGADAIRNGEVNYVMMNDQCMEVPRFSASSAIRSGIHCRPLCRTQPCVPVGLTYIYVPFEVDPGGLGAAVAGLKALGVAGFNVTIPHKTGIMRYLDELDDSALSAGAVNTVKNDCGRLVGYNTDGDGLLRSLANEFGFNATGASIALIGAGGAARGAVSALCRAGAGNVIIANRSREKAVELVSLMSQRYPDTRLSFAESFEELEERLSAVDVLINTTSLGMNPDDGPIVRLDNLARSAIVYDMVYAPPVTPLLSAAGRTGA